MLEYSERVKRGGASTINNAARILTQRLNALTKEQKTAGGHIFLILRHNNILDYTATCFLSFSDESEFPDIARSSSSGT